MMYDYLFYQGYKWGKASGNFDDTPVLAGTQWIVLCAIFNIATLLFLVEGLGVKVLDFNMLVPIKYLIGLVFVVGFSYYYKYKERWKRIVLKYEARDKNKIYPIVIILLYVAVSFLLMMLAAMYKNHDGVFA